MALTSTNKNNQIHAFSHPFTETTHKATPSKCMASHQLSPECNPIYDRYEIHLISSEKQCKQCQFPITCFWKQFVRTLAWKLICFSVLLFISDWLILTFPRGGQLSSLYSRLEFLSAWFLIDKLSNFVRESVFTLDGNFQFGLNVNPLEHLFSVFLLSNHIIHTILISGLKNPAINLLWQQKTNQRWTY